MHSSTSFLISFLYQNKTSPHFNLSSWSTPWRSVFHLGVLLAQFIKSCLNVTAFKGCFLRWNKVESTSRSPMTAPASSFSTKPCFLHQINYCSSCVIVSRFVLWNPILNPNGMQGMLPKLFSSVRYSQIALDCDLGHSTKSCVPNVTDSGMLCGRFWDPSWYHNFLSIDVWVLHVKDHRGTFRESCRWGIQAWQRPLHWRNPKWCMLLWNSGSIGLVFQWTCVAAHRGFNSEGTGNVPWKWFVSKFIKVIEYNVFLSSGVAFGKYNVGPLLSSLYGRIPKDGSAVLPAASTVWNFLNSEPQSIHVLAQILPLWSLELVWFLRFCVVFWMKLWLPVLDR